MQEENMGTAMVTPASASAYCSARLPKKMQKPEAMAKPMEDLFSCTHAQHHHHLHPAPLPCMKTRTGRRRAGAHAWSCGTTNLSRSHAQHTFVAAEVQPEQPRVMQRARQ